MKILTIEQVRRLRYALEEEFGFMPENVIIECPEVVDQALDQMSITNQEYPKSITDLRLYGVRVAKEIVEIESL